MNRIEFSLPFPITVTYQRHVQSKRNELKTHVTGDFSLPSFSSHEVALVAQWTQAWDEDSSHEPTHIVLGNDSWLSKLREAKHLVALVEKDGKFYVPVRVREELGQNQHLVTAASAAEAVRMVNKPKTPFGHLSFYPPYMYTAQHNIEEGAAGFTEADLPEGKWHIETNESERSKVLQSFMEQHYIVVDGIMFSRVSEPKLVLDFNFDRAVLSITTRQDGPTFTTRYGQFYRLDELDRVQQLMEEYWEKEQMVSKFDGLLCACTDGLSERMELDEGRRLVGCHFEIVGRSLQSLNWAAAGPWYEIKELMEKETTEEVVEQMFDAVRRSVKAIENDDKVDPEWRDSVVLYGSAACDRWDYRPLRSAARTL